MHGLRVPVWERAYFLIGPGVNEWTALLGAAGLGAGA